MLIDGNEFGISEKFGIALLIIKDRVYLGYAFKGKGLDEFFPAENFLVGSRIPAQQDQEIAQGPGQETLFPVELDGNDLTMTAFGDLFFLQIQGKRHVRENRGRRAQGLIEQHLSAGVGHVVLAADNMGDTVPDIVNHVTEQIKRFAIGADNDKILDVRVCPFNGPQHLVFIGNHAFFLRHLETDDRGQTHFLFFPNLFRGKVPAGAVVADVLFGGKGVLAFFFQLFPGAETFVGVAGIKQLLSGLLMIV